MATTSTAARARVAPARAITPNAARPPARKPGGLGSAPYTKTTIISRFYTPGPPATGVTVTPPHIVVGPIPAPTSAQVGQTYGKAVISRSHGAGSVTQGSTGTPKSNEGGTVGGSATGGFDNALSGDLLGRFGLTLPRVLELLAIALAAWLGWKYLSRKAGGKRRG